MRATYYARTSDHGYETCAEHLAMAGCLAGGFAKGFGYLDDGLLAGLVHDLGKYSDAFQRRIRNPDHCGPVDHSTAGALLLMRHVCPLAAMAVAGHHAGLPDLGSYGELEGSTFMSRMNRARRAGDCNPLALAQAGEAQLDIPQSAFLHGTRSAKPMTSGKRPERWSLYTDMMLTRMLFSALVDADRLDAEFFTSNRIDRAEHHILESLKKHLGPQNLASGRVPAFDALREASLTVSVERDAEDRSRIDRLAAIMENTADGYLAAPGKRPIDIRRCELLERCLARGKDPSYGTGLYTLTAPTGSGKTISSIAFALEHAHTNNLRRVIYVIPYTSIIDQTVGQFEAIFGTDAVLPHYSEAPYQLKNESDMDATDLRRALAAENWNAPIVVTTAVQFFESLYSNVTSRCRKLHNIADSVIVFDEAQTLPVPYLRPCVRAIAELVERYGSTAVLCTATQPELQPLLDESFDGDHVRVPEISPFTRDDRDSFRRVTIKRLGDIALDALAERLGGHKQVLCVVNTRSKAQYLHDRLADDDAEGSFCLTTLQCAADRQRLFAEIRDRLDAGASCRVVSTSLIEAGVDVDFPVAYREEAGLDSVIQTAGRCNREGRRPASESVVHVFSTEGGCAPFLRQNIAAFRAVADRHADLNTDEAVRAYFAEVLCLRNGGVARANVGNDALDRKRILPLHGRDANWPFADIAKRFRLIDTPTIPVYIPLPGDGALLCERLERGDMDRTLFRKLGRYAVNTTALNTLLADRDRVQRIGGDTVVSWANCGDNAYRDVWDQYMGQSGGLSEKVVVDATRALAQGKPYDYEEIHLSPDEQFHILALSPNAARLSVRFYLTDTFGTFARNIDRHYRDTAIRRPSYDSTTFLPTWRLLNQTIRTQSKTAKASPQMAGAVMKAILEGTPYPMTLINAVERRINAEHDVSPDKAAIIKAYYLRATTNAQFKEVLRMDINEESDYLPYVLGRMFSIYEQIQLAAIPGINTTIKDKYFTSASTTPARIFPILGDLAAKHMRKAWKSKGLKVKLDKALGELTGRVGDRYPSRLSLEERGAFQLGYYFENQKRFDKTNKNNNEQGENND